MRTIRNNGSTGIFLDLPNLTQDQADPEIGLNSNARDQAVSGRFWLETILEAIDAFARELSQSPVAVRWAANYPPNSLAVAVCLDKQYQIAQVPRQMHEKDLWDTVLQHRIRETREQYPTINHYVIVTGDKDFLSVVDDLLTNSKYVHLIEAWS
jgi:uncharacterized LabA/DUF88 family protein